VIYLDQAATSFPKPPEVREAVMRCLAEYAVNPGRGDHQLVRRAQEQVSLARRRAAELFHIRHPERVLFFLNATQAINQAIKGLVRPGDHVIASGMEHNAVRRPLLHLQRNGVEVTFLKGDRWGVPTAEEVDSALRENTRLVILNHASNVTGAIADIGAVGQRLRQKGVAFMVDAAQSAGVLPIDVEEMGIHLLAFAGHKGLYGPQGVGGLYISEELDLVPLIHGGTGIHSSDADQPVSLPERYESGTLNTPGLAGLAAGLEIVLARGVDAIYRHEWELIQHLQSELEQIPGVTVYGPPLGQPKVGVLSFQVEGYHSEEVAILLDEHFRIAVRGGLHCAPLVHERLGTLGSGTIRASVGLFNTHDEIGKLVAAVRELI
jgi:cysteine desulfurase family protein